MGRRDECERTCYCDPGQETRFHSAFRVCLATMLTVLVANARVTAASTPVDRTPVGALRTRHADVRCPRARRDWPQGRHRGAAPTPEPRPRGCLGSRTRCPGSNA